ncbi:MAG: penicillin-binding transpeptidase domain-containing protein [Opitutae bacterium]
MSRLIETHSARNPRLLLFHGAIAAMVLLLGCGLVYRQLIRTTLYNERERLQSLRRIVVPGPRGNLYDRDGQMLVGNRPRFSVVLNLAELRGEFRAEYRKIEKNYASAEPRDRPNDDQLSRIARATVAQRYLDKINALIGRREAVRTAELNRHFTQSLLLPYVLLNDLAPEEYARLIERLPVSSPLQVYTSSTRSYPFRSVAAHTLGYTGVNNDPEVEDFEGEDLLTFKMKGSVGRAGLEKIFDEQLQGETGGAIYLVDPAGYKVTQPVDKRLQQRRPVQGHNLITSLDSELQLAAENAMEDKVGAVVALDVKTGEVLVMASKPDYDLATRIPNLTPDQDVEKSGVWLNRATQGQYPPGSTFKVITSTAGLRSGAIERGTSRIVCPGYFMVGNRRFPCDAKYGHGEVDLIKAITVSCNVFFYKFGLDTGPDLIAAEAHRFGFDHKTGIELPYEFSSPHVASPAWKLANLKERWVPGDTANTAIGQGDTLVTPLQVACMMASFARGETETKPTLLHDPNRPAQHTEPIGLSPADYNGILQGLEQCYEFGTAKLAKVEGLRAAAKTGTAQKGRIDLAWMIAFAPIENPRIAIAVVMEGTEPDVGYHGGTYAAPIVKAILETWKEKSERQPAPAPVNFKVQ